MNELPYYVSQQQTSPVVVAIAAGVATLVLILCALGIMIATRRAERKAEAGRPADGAPLTRYERKDLARLEASLRCEAPLLAARLDRFREVVG